MIFFNLIQMVTIYNRFLNGSTSYQGNNFNNEFINQNSLGKECAIEKQLVLDKFFMSLDFERTVIEAFCKKIIAYLTENTDIKKFIEYELKSWERNVQKWIANLNVLKSELKQLMGKILLPDYDKSETNDEQKLGDEYWCYHEVSKFLALLDDYDYVIFVKEGCRIYDNLKNKLAFLKKMFAVNSKSKTLIESMYARFENYFNALKNENIEFYYYFDKNVIEEFYNAPIDNIEKFLKSLDSKLRLLKLINLNFERLFESLKSLDQKDYLCYLVTSFMKDCQMLNDSNSNIDEVIEQYTALISHDQDNVDIKNILKEKKNLQVAITTVLMIAKYDQRRI